MNSTTYNATSRAYLPSLRCTLQALSHALLQIHKTWTPSCWILVPLLLQFLKYKIIDIHVHVYCDKTTYSEDSILALWALIVMLTFISILEEFLSTCISVFVFTHLDLGPVSLSPPPLERREPLPCQSQFSPLKELDLSIQQTHLLHLVALFSWLQGYAISVYIILIPHTTMARKEPLIFKKL